MRAYWVWVAVGLFLTGCVPLTAAAEVPGSPPFSQGLPTQAPELLGRYTTPPAAPVVQPPATLEPVLPTEAAQLLPTEAAATASPAALPSSTPLPIISPLEGYRICSPVAEILLEDLLLLISDGYHPPPLTRSDARHVGVDIAFFNWKGYHQIAGAPVQSVLPGRVAAAEVDTFPFGNVLIIETQAQQLPADVRAALGMDAGQSLYLLSAHMQEDSLRVMLGEAVTACQTLGRVGRTGNSGQAHLHLETRQGAPGSQFIGLAYYTDAATQAEMENYQLWATSGEYKHFDPLRLLLYEFGYKPTPKVVKQRWE